ncbi:hypothetical protein AA12717_1330 [Gluconacetobacter sacchari DSM 12717]|uniref:Uncharacterized protein n=1 Tax=Gluconacetobacter sacchari DSM 12717 TaxID=1307940 RepID=A0ABQ0P684_9PROT|nr:hypothetical protein [Gluconacetobacter sacchari]GBQ22906.1 hypothetical protein AA12717_1330 [Gluconacetobacter sacchari DSM 12717]
MTDEPLIPPDKWLAMGGDLTNCLWTSAGDLAFYEDLPITDALKARLEAWEKWAGDYEDFLPREKRAPFDLPGFTASGLEIARALKAELPDWTIVYRDEFKWQHQEELGLTPAECSYEV